MPKNKYKNENLLYTNPIGNNIRVHRMNKHWTQADLVDKLQEEMNVSDAGKLSVLSISAYEAGNRVPPLVTLIALSNLFNVTVDELIGKPGKRDAADQQKDEPQFRTPLPEFDLELRPQEYWRYNGQPVFVKGPDGLNVSRWAILDYKNDGENINLIFTHGKAKLRHEWVLYRHRPLETAGILHEKYVPLKIDELRRHKLMWIESISIDPTIKERYSGYYRNSEDLKNLINVTNGLTLPYTGVNLSYLAFSMDAKEAAK